MDQALQSQFQRVETALGTLVDSIAAYNPSPQAAVDLIAADDELSRGLDQLAQHYANHTRIQTLRAEADALEEQLKSSVAALASLRRELFETPATIFPTDSRPVPFDELFQFATNISKHTVPPTYRERIPTPPKLDQDKETQDDGSSGPASNGVSTPAQELPKDDAQGEGDGAALKEITAEEAEWLRALKESGHNWTPWPSNDKIRASNLMQIQYLLDTNQDPTKVDLTMMGEAEKEMIAAEAEKQAAAQAPVEVPEVPVQSQPKAPAPSRPPEQAPAVFGGFDDIFTED